MEEVDIPTLICHWVFSTVAVFIMCARLVWRKLELKHFHLGDHFTIAALLCAIIRMCLIHVVLIWGNNNMTPAFRAQNHFTPEEIYRRRIGSQLLLVNRFFYVSYLWLQKLVLLEVYRRLLRDLSFDAIVIRSYMLVFLVTYVAVQATLLAECKPVRLYWQIMPDPGKCAEAQVQLLTLGTLSIITDVMLLILPLPVITIMRAPWTRKIQLYLLFTLAIFIVIITIIRLPINTVHKFSQVNRTMWASTEILAAAIVVNAPCFYSLWGMRKNAKKERLWLQLEALRHPGTRGGGHGCSCGNGDSNGNMMMGGLSRHSRTGKVCSACEETLGLHDKVVHIVENRAVTEGTPYAGDCVETATDVSKEMSDYNYNPDGKLLRRANSLDNTRK